jgi:putative ABC transport system permease protein
MLTASIKRCITTDQIKRLSKRIPTMNSIPFSLSWAWLKRDFRAGELKLLLIALIVATTSLAAVNFFADRMRLALAQQARSLLGGDLIVASDNPIPADIAERAARLNLQVAQTVSFPSMVQVGDGFQLSSVKAVSPNYPLRGALKLGAVNNAPLPTVIGKSEVWIDQSLLSSNALIKLGDTEFKATAVIELEPDRGANFASFSPRVMIALDDLAKTKLIQPGSRVTYRLLLAGAAADVASFEKPYKNGDLKLARGQRIESLEGGGRPELKATLERAERFLALVALLSALIAAVAIALAAQRFAQRHLDGCAVMRTLGLKQKTLFQTLAFELVWIGLIGSLIGSSLGWALHFLLVSAIQPMLQLQLPSPSVWPLIQACVAGFVLLIGFGALPFLATAGVSPLKVLRRDLPSNNPRLIFTMGLALVAFGGLLFWLAGDVRLALIAIAGFLIGTLIFAFASWALVVGLARLRKTHWFSQALQSMPALRLAFAGWDRNRGSTLAQTVALAVGLMALLLLTVTRTDLIDSWRQASPPTAPNRFVINIQPDQAEPVTAQLKAAGIGNVELSPMVRGRLIEVNGKPITPQTYTNDRAKGLVDREFNLSYTDLLPSHNQVIEGQWHKPNLSLDRAEVSAEQGIMKTLGLVIGDEVVFEVAGERALARITSVRKLQWDSMKVNFFMILSPAVLKDKSQSLITAYHQPSDAKQGVAVDKTLLKTFPNLTVFDASNIVRQVQTILDQVVKAVQFLFLLTLVAGAVVLYGAMLTSREVRQRESALMRTLGASSSQLMFAQLVELLITGALAGLLAGGVTIVIGQVLAEQVFQFEYPIQWSAVGIGLLGGIVVSLIAGWFGLRGVLATPPLLTLRQATE